MKNNSKDGVTISAGSNVGHYEVIQLLGSGGMGEVYLARDVRLGRHVALKILAQQARDDHMAVQRFLREAQAASALNHPNIVTIHESGEAEARHFIAMELIQGSTLRALMGRPSTLEEFLAPSVQMARALSAAHSAGIIHRDIKPENIMVRDDGYVKVLDFGVARQDWTSSTDSATTQFATATGALVGSPRYMSPEQARGEKLTTATDIFSLGIVFYEFATGRHPFGNESHLSVLNAILNQQPIPPSRLNPYFSGTLEAAILRMLDKNPRLRPASAELESILAEPAGRESLNVTKVPVPQRITVGRRTERVALRAAFDVVAEGNGVLVSVEGEAGIGKSTLVETFLSDLAEEKLCSTGRGRSSERLEGTEAFLPVLEAMESLIYGENGGAMARIMKLLAPTWYLQVASMSTVDGSGAQLIAAAQAASPERLRRELSAFLQEASRLRPVVLFFEDLHWADLSTVDLIAHVASRFAHVRVLIIVTCRRQELLLAKHPFLRIKRDLQARNLCREILLDFLSHTDVKNYLDLEFPDHRFPPDFHALVYAKTEGNPLFMVDVLRYLKDRNVIVKLESCWSLAESVVGIERQLPESVRGMIQRKIDILDENDRRLLVAASVQGYEFYAAVLAHVLDRDAADVEERLDELERVHGFIRAVREQEFPDGSMTVRFRFVHVLYQNALYASLKPTRRISLSVAVGRTLEEFYKNQTAEIASELAVLFESGRDFDRAAGYFRRAAQNAFEVFGYHEAVLLSRRGLEVLKGLERTTERIRCELMIRMVLGMSLIPIAGFGDTELQENFNTARKLGQDIDAGPALAAPLTGLFGYYIARMELATARELARQVEDLAVKSGDSVLLTRAYQQLGVVSYFSDDLPRSIQYLEKGLSYYDPSQYKVQIRFYPIDAAVVCRSLLGRSLFALGYPNQAVTRVSEAVEAATALSHPPSLAWALFFASIVYKSFPDDRKGRETVDALIALSTEHGLPYWKAHGVGMRGLLLHRDGKTDEAIRLLQMAVEGLRTGGNQASIPYFTGLLAQALQSEGRYREGLELVEAALQNTPRIVAVAELYSIKAQLLTGLDKLDEAAQWFEKAVSNFRAQKARTNELQTLTSWILCCPNSAQAPDLRRQLSELYDSFTEGFDTIELKAAKAVLVEHQ